MNMTMINPSQVCWVGVDVSKATLDVYLWLPEQALSFPIGNRRNRGWPPHLNHGLTDY
jgi:hypothetical protein